MDVNDELRNNLRILVDTQLSLLDLKELIEKKDENQDKLIEIWNSIIDMRGVLLEQIGKNSLFNVAGLRECFVQMFTK